MEELRLTPEAQQIVALSRAMKKLVELPEFKEYLEVGKRQIAVWTAQALSPATSSKEVREREFQKGVIYGIQLNLSTPSRIIADATDIRSRMENPNGNRRTNPDASSPNAQFDLFGVKPVDPSSSPESIAAELDEPVGPAARVTADSN